MSPYWQLARKMFRYRARLAFAFSCAIVSALGLGVGLLGIMPILSLLLKQEETLPEMAQNWNAADPLVTIPTWIVDRLPEDPMGGVIAVCVPLAVLTLIGSTCNFLHQYLSMSVAAKTAGLIRQEAFNHVVLMPLGRVVERGPAEFVSRIVRDTVDLQGGFVALVSRSVAQALKGAAALVIAIAIQPGVTIVAIVLGVTLGVILKKLGKRVRRGTKSALAAQQQLLRIATEMIQGLRAVKASTGERSARRRFHLENKEVVRHELKVRFARALSPPISETVALFAVGAVAIAAAGLIANGLVSSEQFIASLIALGIAGGSFRPLAGLINEIYAAAAPSERLVEILDEPRERSEAASRNMLPRHHASIELESVTLTYPGAPRPALDDVTLRFEHGERVAIVGPNGSGKTTMVSLVPRLLRPSGGRVLVDGVDIESVSLRGLRRQIGVVTQETVLFRGTIAENIAFGSENADRAAIGAAARAARADDFIQAMDGGYDADVLEQGASLSGGQRQRLAIARAILRDPAILILDEATSQIDAESEVRIGEALAEFSRGRTVLVIAHRLATVLDADRIVVMNEGKVEDVGTHEELLTRCPLYARLAQTALVSDE